MGDIIDTRIKMVVTFHNFLHGFRVIICTGGAGYNGAQDGAGARE